MSNFTPLVTKKLTFEDEEVTIRFARLKRKHVLKHLGLFTEYSKAFNDTPDVPDGETDPNAEAKLKMLQPFLDDISDKVPEYVKEITGLTDAAGNPIGIETVVEDSYFMMLMMNVVLAMTEASLGHLGKTKSGS